MGHSTLSFLIVVFLSSISFSAHADDTETKTMHEKHMKMLTEKKDSASATKSPSLAIPLDEMNQLDQRTPVPLPPQMALHQKQNMREHLESVQEIIAGLSKKDFKAIATGAKRMGLTPEMGKMCEMMGAGATGFSERAIQFHKSADEIALFAQKKDERGVMNGLNKTLTQCTSCHATYRQQIVSESAYKAFSK